MFLSDPVSFLEKVVERFRQSGIVGFRKIQVPGDLFGKRSRRTANLIAGEYSKVLADVDVPKRTKQRIREHLDLFEWAPVDSGNRYPVKGRKVLAFLTNSFPHTLSGYTVRSQKVLEAVKRAGYEVEAVTRAGYPFTVGKFANQETETVGEIIYTRLLPSVHQRSLLDRTRTEIELLERRARKNRPNLIYTTSDFRNAVVVSHVAAKLEIPWIYEVRGEPEKTWLSKVPTELRQRAARSEFYLERRRLEVAAMQACSAVVVLSEVSKKAIIDRGVPANKVWVVPNCVDEELTEIELDKHSARRKIKLEERTWIGTVTSVVDYEGLDVLIDALSYLPEDIGVLVVGDGIAMPKLQKQVRDKGVAGRVRFVGRKPREEIVYWYSALDLFVLPRKDLEVCRSVTPIKAMEAMALGVPVVASDLPAIREVTGGNALFFAPDDPGALAAAVLEALDDHDLPSVGRDWAASRTWEYATAMYAEVIASLGG